MTLPAFSPEVANGSGWVAGGGLWSWIAGGLVALSAGLAVRASTTLPPIPTRRSSLKSRLTVGLARATLAVGVVGVIALTVLAAWELQRGILGPAMPGGLAGALDKGVAATAWNPVSLLIRRVDSYNGPGTFWEQFLFPENWPAFGTAAWIAAMAACGLLARWRGQESAFDRALADRGTAARFLGLWAAFAVVLAGALATIWVATMVLPQIVLNPIFLGP